MISHEHFHSVYLENAALSALPYLVAVEQFHLSGAFIVFILDADASFPFLDFTL